MFHVYWPVIALVAAVLLVSLLRFLFFSSYIITGTPGLVTFNRIVDIQFEGCQPRIGG